MLRVFECSGAETERLERVTRESEGKERERRRGEKGKVGNSRTAESPVDPKPTTTTISRVVGEQQSSLRKKGEKVAESLSLRFHSLRLPQNPFVR